MPSFLRRARPFAVATLVSLGVVVAFARCSAEGTPSPEPPGPVETGQCQSLETSMPEFFRMLRDPSQPLAGLRAVVEALAVGDSNSVQGNPVGVLLAVTVKGVKVFTQDPDEGPDRCLALPPDEPLCVVEAAEGARCESRFCALRRVIDFGVRDQGAIAAFDSLRPLLVKLLRYAKGSGVGDEHLELIQVLHNTSQAEALCSPFNLLALLDGVVTYFRNNAACSANRSCVSYKALDAIDDLLADPKLDDFLTSYESGTGDRSRAAFQVLGRQLLNSVANTPEDETYFDGVQNIADTLLLFLDGPGFEELRPKVETVVELLRGLMNPNRPNALLAPLKGVARCLADTTVDPNMDLVGSLFDMVSLPANDPSGLDLRGLVQSLIGLAEADPNGIVMGLLHAIFRSSMSDPDAQEAMRQFFGEALTTENARLALPALTQMVDKDVIGEIVVLLDNLLYGCRSQE